MRDFDDRSGTAPSGFSRRAFLGSSAAAFVVSSGSTMLGACAGDDGSAGGQGDGSGGRSQLTFLTILPMTSLTFAPDLLADAGGYFDTENLDVTFELTRGSAQAIQLVLAGRAPLTRIEQIEGMRAAANREAPLVNVGTVIKESTIRYVSSAQDALREPADFVGKTVGIPSEGGSSEMTLDLLLATSGIDPASVSRQVVGLSPGTFNLVEQGRLAGYAVSIDTAKVLEQQQSGVVVLRPGDFMSSGAQFYMASEDGVAQNGEAIRKYLSAVHAALDFMINDDGFDETLRILRSKYSFDGLDDTDVARESLTEYVRGWTAGGRESVLRTDPQSWASGYEELVRVDLVEPGADPQRWFTNELLQGT